MSKYQTEIEDLIWEYNTSGKDLETAMLREIGHVYSQASKADEYEAKAEAFDRIVEERNRIGKLMHNKEYPQVFTDEAFWNIDDIINDTESGERNES